MDILNERMTLTAGDRTVANWPLDQLEIVVRADGFHVRVDGEEMVLNVTDSKGFAAALGVEASPVRPVAAAPGLTSTSLRPTGWLNRETPSWKIFDVGYPSSPGI